VNGEAAITFNPALPMWLLALLGALGVIAALRRTDVVGWTPTMLRVVSLTLLGGVLAGPTRIATSGENGLKPSLDVLLDTSASMGVCDIASETGPSRLDAVRRAWFDPDVLAALQDRADVRFFAFDADLRALDASVAGATEAHGDASDIPGALSSVLRYRTGSGRALLLSDGAATTNAGIDAAVAQAVARGAAIDTVAVGRSDALADSAIELVADRSSVRARERVTLRATVAGGGGRVMIAQISAGGATQTLFDGPAGVGPISVSAQPPTPEGERADVLYLATLTPDETDADPRNNESIVAIDVRTAPIHVLVLEGQPSWQTRYFLDAIRSDPRFDTTAALAVGGRETVRRYSVDPAARVADDPTELLRTADVVVLGKGVERWVDAERAAALADRLTQRGGALVYLRGDPFREPDTPVRDALNALSPVQWGRQALDDATLRATGEAPVAVEQAIARLPGAMTTVVSEGERTLARVWLRAQSASMPTEPAALASMRVGAGVSLAVMTDDLWRWAMAQDNAAPASFALFWSAALRALAGESLDSLRDVRLSLSDLNPRVGEAISVHVAGLRAQSVQLTIDADGAGRQTIGAPGLADPIAGWEASIAPATPGIHRVRALDGNGAVLAEALFIAQASAIEMATTRARPELLADLSEATGGRALPPDGVSEYLALLASERSGDSGEPTTAPLWTSGWLFALIAGMLLVEWTLRRLRGAP
jgi:hypothetical protein